MTQHAISDETAREALNTLRNEHNKLELPNHLLDALAFLRAYVAERLPVETVQARWVHWYPKTPTETQRREGPFVDTIPEDQLPDFIRKLITGGATDINIGPSYDRPIR